MRNLLVLIAVASIVAAPSHAEMVNVEVTGSVEYNQVTSGLFASVTSGDPATISIAVDSNVFINSSSFPTRGYVVNDYMLTLGAVAVGLQNPFPSGETPYFVLRNNDPAVDGFFISRNVDFPNGLPLNEVGRFGNFASNFLVTYDQGRLPSLDILDALGVYDFTGLQVFSFSVQDGPFDAIGLIFEQMVISTPLSVEPASWGQVKSIFSR